MKKALPGMAKGVAKVVGAIAATALLGIGAVKFTPMLTNAITTKFMAGKAALAGYANADAVKQIGGLKAELAKQTDTKKVYDLFEKVSPSSKGIGKYLPTLSEKADVAIGHTTGEIAKLTKSLANKDMPVKELATKAMKVFSHDASEYVSKAGESIKGISSEAAKSVSESLHKGVSESVKFIGENSKKVEGAWKHLGEKATEVVGEAQGKATQMVGEAQLDISNMYKSVETNLGHLAVEAKKMGAEAYAELKEGAGKVVKKMGEEATELNKMAHTESEKVYKYLASEGSKAKSIVEKDYEIVKGKLNEYADKAQSAYNERYGEHFTYTAADTKKISGLETSLRSAQEAAKNMRDLTDSSKVLESTKKIKDLKSQLDAAHTAAKAAGHTSKVNSIMTDVFKASSLIGVVKNFFKKKDTAQNKKAADDKEMDEFAGEIQKYVMEEMNKLKDSAYLEKLMKG